ncbi:MAG: hypothetical protein HC797_03485, partial [Anaerolineales bacterium]|nr:hypothetical protein [Anaerolineales bacterium]
MFPDLGVSLFIAGLVVVVLARVVLGSLSRTKATEQVALISQTFPESTQSNDAILIVQPGGRVEYLSNRARSYFGLRENEPYDLE